MIRASLLELEAVVAIASQKSFRAAARQLDISPSALSHAISALEQRLGVRLFHRTTRSVSLSAAGEHFVRRLQPALREVSSTLDEVHELRDTPSGTLRINTSKGAAQIEVLPMILEMRRRHPDVLVELVTEDRLVDIVAEGFDAGVRLAEAVPQDMVAIPCGADLSMAVVGAPSYFASRPKPTKPKDLLDHECIRRRMASGQVYRWELEKRGREVAIDIRGALTLDNDDLILQAALDGAGLAFVSDRATAADVEAGRLVRVLADWTPPFPGLRLFHPSHRLVRAALRAFIAIVQESTPRGHGHGKAGNPNERSAS
ncbi:LysR family transcriptional regulator [Polyangium mundeleinium]|uniref:LysR family transcriptional regulator n=1 Tax=Polyangium mundeleinium TaxID=2995306 RepID=A0ABT5EI32_9BACT|nr:LysR family transcriptional regulator [Polyangium mundeleinium]MDC0740577.1 LysR family transcriptional regulator [Polyangium mundeleinium]